MTSLTLGKKVCFTCSTIIGKNQKSINCLTLYEINSRMSTNGN